MVQAPDFGDRFWVYAAYDQRTDQFGELGKPYGTKPGFYLLVGPNWDGEVPEGIAGVAQSATALGNIVPRVFMDDTAEDRAAIQPLVNQIVAAEPVRRHDEDDRVEQPSRHPQSRCGQQRRGPVDRAGEVLRPARPRHGPRAAVAGRGGALRPVPLAARPRGEGSEGQGDHHRRGVAADKEVIADFFRWEHNGKPAGNNWHRSLHNAEWGVDYYDRTGTARSNLLDNRPTETQYFYTDLDSGQLNSARSYEVTFPAGELPPVKGFWSLTLQYHLFTPNELNRFSVGTKSADLVKNEDGSLTIYVSREQPEGKPEANWLPAPEGDFSLYIRAYWGEEPILDGSWQPPAIKGAS